MDESKHGWIGLTEAGHYANINPDVLRGAIIRGELDAYEKPITKGRTGKTRQNVIVRMHREDIDQYIRTHWRKADASTFGLPEVLGEAQCA